MRAASSTEPSSPAPSASWPRSDGSGSRTRRSVTSCNRSAVRPRSRRMSTETCASSPDPGGRSTATTSRSPCYATWRGRASCAGTRAETSSRSSRCTRDRRANASRSWSDACPGCARSIDWRPAGRGLRGPRWRIARRLPRAPADHRGPPEPHPRHPPAGDLDQPPLRVRGRGRAALRDRCRRVRAVLIAHAGDGRHLHPQGDAGGLRRTRGRAGGPAGRGAPGADRRTVEPRQNDTATDRQGRRDARARPPPPDGARR